MDLPPGVNGIAGRGTGAAGAKGIGEGVCRFEGCDGGGDRIFAGRFAVSVGGGVSFCKRMMMDKLKDPLPSASSGDFAPLIPPTPFRYASRIYDHRCAGGGWLAGAGICGFEGRDGGGDRLFAGRFAVPVGGRVRLCGFCNAGIL